MREGLTDERGIVVQKNQAGNTEIVFYQGAEGNRIQASLTIGGEEDLAPVEYRDVNEEKA